MTTPKLNMPELVVGQAGKELTHNQALAILDQLAQAVVVDKDLTAPPGSPANGAMYIVAAGATGAWAGQVGNLAFWLASIGVWTFITPADGWRVWVIDEAVIYGRQAGVWVLGGGLGLGTAAFSNVTTSATDTTAGRLLKVGDFGIGTILAITDANSAPVGGSICVLNTPFTNGPTATNYTLITNAVSAGAASQFAIPYQAGAAVYFRTRSTGAVWSVWTQIWTSANLVKQSSITDLTAGSALLTGAYGLGMNKTIATTNLNTIKGTGWFQCADTAVGSPQPAFLGWWVYQQSAADAWLNQIATAVGSAGLEYRRSSVDGGVTWSPWVKTVNVGNFGLGASSDSTLNIDVATNYQNGFYFVAAGTAGTFPGGLTSGNMLVIQQAGPASGTGTRQIFFPTTTNDIWVRQWATASWTPWESILPIGQSQTWQNMTASRALNTTYTNNTNQPIQIKVACVTTVSAVMQTFINGTAVAGLGTSQVPGDTVIVPPGATYRCLNSAGTASSLAWWELRR